MTDIASSSAATATATTAASAAAPGAGGISSDTSRLASRANLEKAGQKFETVFTGMMLKSMRAAKLSDGLFDSSASDTFRDMQDAQISQSMAVHAPLGIGKAMVDFLAKNQKALQGSQATAAGSGNSS